MTIKDAIRLNELELAFLERSNIPANTQVVEMKKLSLAALQAQEDRKNTERLTIEELKKMDCPVWVSFKPIVEGERNGYWCLCNNGKIIPPSGNIFDVENIPDWKFYRYEKKEV